MIFAVLIMVFVGAILLAYGIIPLVLERLQKINEERTEKTLNKADAYLADVDMERTRRLGIILPIILGIAGAIFFPEKVKLVGVILGIALGFIIPQMHISKLINDRRRKFNDQLMDALMIMSSSFRGGLSLIQAVEAVVDEMPNPIRQEFGIVLGENRMGVALDESLLRLYKRMPSPALQQMITAIILARETGGNLPLIFSRIIGTMRERKKIEQNLQTLTIQGKIQAIVMTGLPIFFVFGVSASNPRFFNPMLNSPDGQKLLMLCVVLWIFGAVSIWRISVMKNI